MIFPIGPHRDVLTQHPHPPTKITQSQPEDFKFSRVIPNRIQTHSVLLDPPPNSFAPDKSTTTGERPRYHPKSTQHPDETSESNGNDST
jgi:hypothetical protein